MCMRVLITAVTVLSLSGRLAAQSPAPNKAHGRTPLSTSVRHHALAMRNAIAEASPARVEDVHEGANNRCNRFVIKWPANGSVVRCSGFRELEPVLSGYVDRPDSRDLQCSLHRAA